MRPLQFDDVWDDHNRPKRKWKWQHVKTGSIVKAENKKEAIENFTKEYNIKATKKDIILLS
jgi:hypothetical protein